MAFLENQSPFQQNLSYLSGQGPLPIGGGQAPGGGGVSAVGSTAPSSAAAPSASSAGAPATSRPAPDQSQLIGQIFNPIQSQLSSFGSNLSGAVGSFNQAAGPARTYDSSGARGALDQSLQTPNVRNLEQAKQFSNAAYTGPQGLDPERMKKLTASSQELQGYGQAFSGGGGGLSSLVQRFNPGLSGGQSRFESQLLSKNPDYQSRARDFQSRLQSVSSQLPAAQSTASQFAIDRGNQEADIASRSKDYVRGKRDDVYSNLDASVGQKQEDFNNLASIYDKFQDTGDVKDLAGTDFDPDTFESPLRKRAREADELREKLILVAGRGSEGSKLFADGQNPIVLGTSTHGREKFKYDPTLRKTLKDEGMTKKGLKRLRKDELIPIQKALSENFSPKVKRYEEAEYALERPLLNSTSKDGRTLGNIDAAPERNYLSFDPGVSPARENVSTEDQRGIINSANEILGNAERMIEAGDEFQAAAIMADVGRYMEDEKRVLDSQRGDVDEASKSWRKHVNKARKRYRKARLAKIAKITEPLMAVSSGGMTEIRPSSTDSTVNAGNSVISAIY